MTMWLRGSFLLSLASFISVADAEASLHVGQSGEIRKALQEVVAQHSIPGATAAIVSSKGVVAMGSAGIRKVGSDEKFRDSDVVHIGSCTKSMTSLLMACLVAEQTITWETQLIDVLPELKGHIHPAYHHVTIWQLLTHRAGVPGNARDWWAYGDLEISQRRLALLKDNLKAAPPAKNGDYLYSNLGYLVAACMVERRTGSTWEKLMQQHVFTPLNMTSAGFGPPGTLSTVDQPWRHARAGAEWQARQGDNAEALGPAGRVHCSVADWACPQG